MKIQIGSPFLILVCGFGIFHGCGAGSSVPSEISFLETKGETGYIQLTVTDSKNPSVLKRAQIEKYKVRIDGEGVEPLEKIISAEATGVVIDGVPAGPNRRVQVLALNGEEQILRDGVVEKVNVEGGKVVEVVLRLEPTPVVLNLANEDYVSNQRLYFHLFSDPNHSVTVEEDRLLTDVVTSLSQAQTNEKGEAKFYPGVLPEGPHSFVIKDWVSEKSFTLSLHLWNGAQTIGAPLFAASQVQGDAPALISRRWGQVWARRGFQGKGGEFFPNIVEALWEKR